MSRAGPPLWVVASLIGLVLALVAITGFYLGIYFALGAEPVVASIAMFAPVPLAAVPLGWLAGRRFGTRWLRWTLIAIGIAAVVQIVLVVIGFALQGNSGLITRVALLALLQQGVGLPFALLTAWLAGRRSRVARG